VAVERGSVALKKRRAASIFPKVRGGTFRFSSETEPRSTNQNELALFRFPTLQRETERSLKRVPTQRSRAGTPHSAARVCRRAGENFPLMTADATTLVMALQLQALAREQARPSRRTTVHILELLF